MPTFCVNLASATGRWETMTRRFKESNIEAVRWEAASPADLGSYSYANYLSPAQRACAKSHCDLWAHQVSNKIPVMMVFEDDAVLRNDFWKILLEKLETINVDDPEWDCLLLNAGEETSPKETWVHAKGQCLTACYILSLRGATELLRISRSTLYASDWMTQILQRRGHSYTYFPWLVIQEENESSIRGVKTTPQWQKVVRLLTAAGLSLENYMF